MKWFGDGGGILSNLMLPDREERRTEAFGPRNVRKEKVIEEWR